MKVPTRFAAKSGSKHNAVLTEQSKNQQINAGAGQPSTNGVVSSTPTINLLLNAPSSTPNAVPSIISASTTLTNAQLLTKSANEEKEALKLKYFPKYSEKFGEILGDIMRMYVRMFFDDFHATVLDYLLEKESYDEKDIFDALSPSLSVKTNLKYALDRLYIAKLITKTVRTEVSKIDKAKEALKNEILGSNYDKFEKQKKKNEYTIWFIDYKTAMDAIVYKLHKIEQIAKDKQNTTFTIQYLCSVCKKRFTNAALGTLKPSPDGSSLRCDYCGMGQVVEDETQSLELKNNTQLHNQFCDQFKPILELIQCLSVFDLVIMAKLEPIQTSSQFLTRENAMWEEKYRSREKVVTFEAAQQLDNELHKENMLRAPFDESLRSKDDSGFGKSKEQELDISTLKRKANPTEGASTTGVTKVHEQPAWLDPSKRRRLDYYGIGDPELVQKLKLLQNNSSVKEEKVMGIEDEDDYVNIHAFQQNSSSINVKTEQKNISAPIPAPLPQTSSLIPDDYGITFDEDENAFLKADIDNSNNNDNSNSAMDSNSSSDGMDGNTDQIDGQFEMQQQQPQQEEVYVAVQGEYKRLSEITDELSNMMTNEEYEYYYAKLQEAQQS